MFIACIWINLRMPCVKKTVSSGNLELCRWLLCFQNQCCDFVYLHVAIFWSSCYALLCSLSLVHTSDIRISTIGKQSMTSPLGLAKTKREFFFVGPFVLLLAYAWTMILCLWRSLFRRLEFIPLFYPYAYAYARAYAHAHAHAYAYAYPSCEPGFSPCP